MDKGRPNRPSPKATSSPSAPAARRASGGHEHEAKPGAAGYPPQAGYPPKAGARCGGAAFELVAVASSAGGLKALTQLLSALPAGFPVAVVVVQHLDPRHPSLLADILGRRTALQVKQAEEGDQLRQGCVFIAPPDQHLLVTSAGSLSLSHAELVRFVRPSADLLFESVAASYKDRAIAVVLTGAGQDGAMGVRAIKKMGGWVIAQDEATSEFFGMPGGAIRTGSVDRILPLSQIAPALVGLVTPGE